MSSPPPSNAESHESRSEALIIVISIFTVLIVLTAGLRVFAKAVSRIRLTLDDYFILMTTRDVYADFYWALNVVANAFDIKACLSGFGQHAHNLDPEDEIQALKYGQLAVGLAGIAYWAAKMTICLFILQILRGTTHNAFRVVIYILIAVVTLSSFITCLIWGLQANPFPRSWDPRIPGTSADPRNLLAAVYFNYSMNIFINLLYAVSPLYFLRKVQMTRKKKAIIFVLIGSGSLIIVVSCINIVYAPSFLNHTDPTWVLVNEFICDIIERNFTVIVANLPGLYMLAGQIRKRTSAARSRSQTRTYGTANLSKDPGKLLQSSIGNGDRKSSSILPLSSGGRKNVGGRKEPWRRVNDTSESGDDEYPLHAVSVKGAGPLDVSTGGISVQTEIMVSKEQREDPETTGPRTAK